MYYLHASAARLLLVPTVDEDCRQAIEQAMAVHASDALVVHADLFVAVASHGLDVLLVAPWDTLDERSDGLARAAREVVRAVARARTE